MAPAVADLIPQQPPRLASAGTATLIADPAGRLLRVNAEGAARGTVRDPAGPTAAVTVGNRTLVGDGDGVTVLATGDLTPVAAFAMPGVVAMAPTPTGDAAFAVSDDGEEGGRVCRVTPAALGPCASLDFAPSGVGATPAGAFVADERTASLRVHRVAGGELDEVGEIDVGARPRGGMASDDGRLYVPVERGIAIVDTRAGATIATVPTETSPADLHVDGTGRLYAALPGSDAVAVLEGGSPREEPVLIPAGPEPVALAGTGARVVVLREGNRTLARVNAAARSVSGSTRIAGLGGATPPVASVSRVSGAASGRVVTITVSLGSGSLQAGGIKVVDRSIADGRAAIELWQGGITSSCRERQPAGRGRVDRRAPVTTRRRARGGRGPIRVDGGVTGEERGRRGGAADRAGTRAGARRADARAEHADPRDADADTGPRANAESLPGPRAGAGPRLPGGVSPTGP